MKKKIVSFTASGEMLDAINKEVEHRGTTKSQVLRQSVREYFEGKMNIPEALCCIVQAQRNVGLIGQYAKSDEAKEAVEQLQQNLTSALYLIGGGENDAHTGNLS